MMVGHLKVEDPSILAPDNEVGYLDRKPLHSAHSDTNTQDPMYTFDHQGG